jgi:hypothetical protein
MKRIMAILLKAMVMVYFKSKFQSVYGGTEEKHEEI